LPLAIDRADMRYLPLFPILLAGALSAQAHVSPSFFLRTEGSSWSSAGIADATASARLLQVHDDVPARTLTALAFRRDGNTTGDFPSLSLVASLSMSTALTTAAAPDRTFDNNHGADRRTVLATQLVQLPAVAYDGFGHAFDYRIPLATPYTHGGIAPLCWELQVVSRSSSTTLWIDAVAGSSTNPGGDTRSFGNGCRVAASRPRALLSGSFQNNWAQSTVAFAYSGSSLPQSQLATLTLGDSASTWGPLTLPIELPGTATAPSGACTVYNSVLLTIPQFTSATGTLSATVAFPAHPSLRGRNLYSQLLVPELTANAYGFVLTNAVQFHPYAPWTTVPIGTVSGAGFGATGTARASFGQVVRFE
jgi:hypothetical protein